MSQADTDRRFMAMALSLGRRGMGNTWPNPAVGAVIVSKGNVVGRGWTQDGGRPHAEIVALSQAGPAAHGATAYVTLEPCSHVGKSPPCADALIAAGIARVVVAADDPNPKVNGAGIARLRTAGIAVDLGVLEKQALWDHAGFFKRIRQGRPHLTLKLATSFDGKIATATGESRWITGPAARRLVHCERARNDAVLVGGGTARADDPDLRVRGLGVARQPVRLVASRHLNLPPSPRMLSTLKKGAPVWLLHGDEEGDVADTDHARFDAAGAELLPVAVGSGGQLDPTAILSALGAKGITRLFCEGGGALGASFLGAGLVDELIGFTAGVALGAEGRPALGAMGLERLDSAPRFDLVETKAAGSDVFHRWVRRQAPSDPD